jgi:hypothetical protein
LYKYKKKRRDNLARLKRSGPLACELCYNAAKPPVVDSNSESENTLSQDVVNCPRCARRTPAARATCLYCGETLPVTKIASAPQQRVIDSAELAFNTILEPVSVAAPGRAESLLAAALKVEPQQARAFIESRKPLPLARSQTSQEAEMIAELVRQCGLAARVVADEEMELHGERIQARRINRAADGIEVQHREDAFALASSEIKLMVIGMLRNTRVDFTEALPRMRAQSGTVLDTAEFFSEETLLDVYTSDLGRSFRIKADAFDYSGIVQPLSFRAEVNFGSLIDELRAIAPAAMIDRDFAKVGGLFARAWPERSRTESGGFKRAGLGLRSVSKSSVIKDNRDQFDRYSRLMFIFSADKKV